MRALFITYDGLTDPLGQSQVIPYLVGLARSGHEIHILSCEKPSAFRQREVRIREILDAESIQWHPVSYQRKFPILSAMSNARKMKKLAFNLQKTFSFDVVHCRSYLPAIIGLEMKLQFKTPFIFDMRGFWADERVEGGVWNLKNPVFRLIYKYFKRKEKHCLREAVHTVTLTHRAKEEVLNWALKGSSAPPIEVIPCCADLDLFNSTKIDPAMLAVKCRDLEIAPEDFVLTYLGSTGTWYLLDEMLDFFNCLLESKPNSKFLFITRDEPETIFRKAREKSISKDRLVVTPSEREDVPSLLSLSDLGIFFIKPVYSKMASSATKCAEMLGMDIPLIVNRGVGDHDLLFKESGCGILVDGFSRESYHNAIVQIDGLLNGGFSSREKIVRQEFSLSVGLERYSKVYRTIEGKIVRTN